MVEELLSSEEARSPSSGIFFCFLLCFFLGVLEPPGSTLLEGELSEGVEHLDFLSSSCRCISSQDSGGMVRCTGSSKVAWSSGSVMPHPGGQLQEAGGSWSRVREGEEGCLHPLQQE
jgi:hypothetical protein